MTMMAMKMMKWWGDNEDKRMIVSPPGSLTCHQHSCRSGRALQLEPRPAPLHRDLKIQNPLPGGLVRGCCSLNSSHRWLCKCVCFMVMIISIIMAMLIKASAQWWSKEQQGQYWLTEHPDRRTPCDAASPGGSLPILEEKLVKPLISYLNKWKGFITHKRSFAPCHPRYSWSEIPLKSKYCLGVLVSRLQ